MRNWRKDFLSKCHLVFDSNGRKEEKMERELEKAYSKIRQLQVEIDFLSDVFADPVFITYFWGKVRRI